MIIDIHQQEIAIADKYKIHINESADPAYFANRKLWRLMAEISLLSAGGAPDSDPVLTVKKIFTPLRATYEIYKGHETYEFSTESIWKPVYQCTMGPDDQYLIYAHRGRKYSIFRNGRQVAWWDKEAISWFAGDNYRIICDDDADKEILIGFCLIIDNYRSDDHDGSTINIDFGNLLEAKKFDTAWQPRAGK